MEQLATGYKIARMDFGWSGIEKQKGVYDFSAYDNLLSQLEAQGVRPYWILDYSNPMYDNGLSPYDDAGRTAFANFAVAAAQHFKGHNIIWEMYNEPNIGFWTPTPNVTAYAQLAVAVGQAYVDAGIADQTIYIGPATSGFDWNFITGCFTGGVLKYFDAVSIHPYRPTNDIPETVLNDYAQLRSLISQYATNPGSPPPIVSGEWGYTTCGPCNPDYNNQAALSTQAKYLARQWLTNALANIPVSIFYDWKDDGTDQTSPEERFGTVQNAYNNSTVPHTPKPSFIAAQTIQKYLPPTKYTLSSRVNAMIVGQSTVDANIYVLAFRSGGSNTTGYAIWKTDDSTSCSNIPSANRTDCGFNGITQGDCTSRNCCFETPYVGPGPQCYFRATSASITFSSSTSGSTCFKVYDYTGASVSSQLCPSNNQFTVKLDK
eukprot:TRINITY_DN22639_c0_g1_i1.p1 TRINITY_DN22639_c0_g1~~TRINITY_DN22639_c0_g1_i1.p1  ORF type:complete len:491 (+),score=69.92 TRINITY_DN22639_c0_g1_i1:178-1473(+)